MFKKWTKCLKRSWLTTFEQSEPISEASALKSASGPSLNRGSLPSPHAEIMESISPPLWLKAQYRHGSRIWQHALFSNKKTTTLSCTETTGGLQATLALAPNHSAAPSLWKTALPDGSEEQMWTNISLWFSIRHICKCRSILTSQSNILGWIETSKHEGKEWLLLGKRN